MRKDAVNEDALLVMLQPGTSCHSGRKHQKTRDLSVSTANYIAYSLDSYLELMVGPQVDTIDQAQISSHLSFQDSDIFPASDKMLMVRIRKESCR